MYPRIPLAIVVFIAEPGLKIASLIWRDNVLYRRPISLAESVQMPLAEIARMIPGIIEHICDRLLPLRQGIIVSRHHKVRIDSRQHGSAKRNANREVRTRHLKIHACSRQAIDIGRQYIRIAIDAYGLSSPLIRNQPDNVWTRFRGIVGKHLPATERARRGELRRLHKKVSTVHDMNPCRYSGRSHGTRPACWKWSIKVAIRS